MMTFILVVMGIALAIFGLYAYVKHLCKKGYGEDEIYLHLNHDVPLWVLKRRRKGYSEEISSHPYKKTAREYEMAEGDAGSHADPEIAALMNARPRNVSRDRQILTAGGWQCGCGRVHAAYVSSCSCGRNKPVPEAIPAEEPAASQVDSANAIREFKKLMDEGLISQEEYEAKKKQLLGL